MIIYYNYQMKHLDSKILYYTHSSQNKITAHINQKEWFKVTTQMNRGPDSELVPKNIRSLYNHYRSDNQPKDYGNPSSGCIYINGANVGQVLEVEIGKIKVNPVGWTRYRGSTGALPGYLGKSNIGEQFKVCMIKDNMILWNKNLSFPVEPMIGVIGLAPKIESKHNGWAGIWGGNFDIQEITTNAKVYLPIEHEGALLHIGDMHARQGDGEICGGGGIETGGEVELRVRAIDRPESMTWPRIEDENYIMTTACEKPAEDAFRIALCEMILWLEEDYKMPQGEAFMFLSQCLEARVTQFVNPTYTYIAKVAKKFLR